MKFFKHSDFFGLYPRPLAEMRPLEILYSASITVFLILGAVSIIQIIFIHGFSTLLAIIGIVIPIITLMHIWFFLLRRKEQTRIKSEVVKDTIKQLKNSCVNSQ